MMYSIDGKKTNSLNGRFLCIFSDLVNFTSTLRIVKFPVFLDAGVSS